MGKGIIKSGGDDGKYNVELTFERDRVDKTIALIDDRIEELNAKIYDIFMGEGATKEREKKIALCELERNSYIKKKEYIQNNMPEDTTVSAWCADLTEDISGSVGTIEVPGERGIVQIQPGYEDNSIYDSTRDGQLQPSIASTPAATFYNLAMLPGWQKWKPTYRYGVISNIDTDANTCDVKLDEVESSQQNLDINQELNLTGILVSYMSCDVSAFESGDNVLVKFKDQTWDGAQVVGFKDNPKACGFQLKLTRGDEILITENSGLLSYIEVYNSNDVLLSTTTPEYSTETECWSVYLVNTEDTDMDGYWVDYSCEDGISTQYPYRYKTDDKDKEADLVFIGEYEDIIPYWKAEIIPFPDANPDDMDCVPYSGDSGIMQGMGYLLIGQGQSISKSLKVYSSVPYKVTFHGRGYDLSGQWSGTGSGALCTDGESYYCMGAYCYYNPGDEKQYRCAMLASYSITGGSLNYNNGAEFKYSYPPSCNSMCISTNPNESAADEYGADITGKTHTGEISNTFAGELNYICPEEYGGPYHYLTGTPLYIKINDYNPLLILAGYDY